MKNCDGFWGLCEFDCDDCPDMFKPKCINDCESEEPSLDDLNRSLDS
jgi:hypothetical protein